jgi:hypothetical protein
VPTLWELRLCGGRNSLLEETMTNDDENEIKRLFEKASGGKAVLEIVDEKTSGQRSSEFLEAITARKGDGYTNCVKAAAEIMSYINLLKSSGAPAPIQMLTTVLAAKYISMAVRFYEPSMSSDDKKAIVEDATMFISFMSTDVNERLQDPPSKPN